MRRGRNEKQLRPLSRFALRNRLRGPTTRISEWRSRCRTITCFTASINERPTMYLYKTSYRSSRMFVPRMHLYRSRTPHVTAALPAALRNLYLSLRQSVGKQLVLQRLYLARVLQAVVLICARREPLRCAGASRDHLRGKSSHELVATRLLPRQ